MIDEQIREIIRVGLGDDLPPLAADEVIARHGSDRSGSAMGARWLAAATVMMVVAAVAGVALIAGSRQERTSTPQTPEVDFYVLPGELPDRDVLVGVQEWAGGPMPAQSVYVDDATGARVSLTAGFDLGMTQARRIQLEDGEARWMAREDDGVMNATFQVERADDTIVGSATGVGEDALPDLLMTVAIDGDGEPRLDLPGYRLVAAAPGGASTAIRSTYYSRPEGSSDIGLELSVQRYDGPMDLELRAGARWEVVERGDRTIHPDATGTAWWSPRPDVVVTVRADTVERAIDVVASLRIVDEPAFADAVATIADAADALTVAERVEFASGPALDLLGPASTVGRPDGLCLDAGTERRCDLSMDRRSMYSESDGLIATFVDMLVGNRWYTVGVAPAERVPDLPIVETSPATDGLVWYLVTHPDDALVPPDELDAMTAVVRPRF